MKHSYSFYHNVYGKTQYFIEGIWSQPWITGLCCGISETKNEHYVRNKETDFH